MGSITASSSRAWIDNHPLKFERYLRRMHKTEDRPVVWDLIYNQFPDEGKKLIENFDLPNALKFELFLRWIIFSPQLTCAIYGDQRMGKDATICYIFDEAIKYMKKLGLEPPRIVVLGNNKNPPFVDEKDMYYSFLNIPSGTKDKEVWIYCSEMELVLPAREGTSAENKLFSHLSGTLAQNHQKLFGCCKLASKVDLNFIRDCNAKIFKYISPEKLGVEGVERVNILSGLGKWLLPKDVHDKSQVLLAFDCQLFTLPVPLPSWWNLGYSEQYNDIPLEKVWEYVDVVSSNGMDLNSIRIAVTQKFRKNLSKEEIAKHLGKED